MFRTLRPLRRLAFSPRIIVPSTGIVARIPATCAIRSIGVRYESHQAPKDTQQPPKQPEGAFDTEYDFEKVQEFIRKPSKNRHLIDVREPHEYIPGHIPTAVNLPIATSPDALALDPSDFQERFGFKKPEANAEVVFYCKAGIRSSAAARLAREWGYTKVGEYKGSWLDWEKNNGKVEEGEGK